MTKVTEIHTDQIITKNNLAKLDNLQQGVMILIDKPLEWTSFDVVNKVRSSLKYGLGIKKIKVGHAGTLDPMATGLLLVCVGKYTKLIDTLTAFTKDYIAEVKIGATTASYDRESDEENILSYDHITPADIDTTLKAYTGQQMQMPPIFSAIKINGQSAHKLARRGQEVEMKKRDVTISRMDCLDINLPILKLDVTCSKGTYIRSLAHDIGQHLGTGAYLHSLIRTKVESYSVANALSIEEVIEWIDTQPEQLKPM